jgi:hypothetical protein
MAILDKKEKHFQLLFFPSILVTKSWIRIRIRIHLKCRIRIHNSGLRICTQIYLISLVHFKKIIALRNHLADTYMGYMVIGVEDPK